MKAMRVFIAIEFEQHIKDYLSKIQKQIMSYSTHGNFSRPENFHLTLKFIGEVQPSFVDKITSAMAQSIHDIKPFKLCLHRLGNFPRGNKMIIWMGVGGELDALNLLFNQLETSLNSIGISKDTRGYSPHITLGREVQLSVPFSKVVSAIATDPQQVIEVRKISLMESTREEGRLTYIPLYRQPLADQT